MPSIRKKETAKGEVFYEIRVSRGRGKSYLTKRWYAPDGWSAKAIDREITKVAAEFERQVADGEVVSKSEQKEIDLQRKREAAKVQTVRQYGESVFMPSKAVVISENGRSTYQMNLNNWVYPAIGDLKMPDVTPANISAILLSMQSQGKAHATVIKVYTILNSLFKAAFLDDTIERNPMDKVQRPKPRKDEVSEHIESYTVPEMQRILSALENEPIKWRAFLRLMIDTGIRRGECCGLRWRDVDFKAGTITVAGNLCYTPQKGVYLDTPKNGKTRTMDVDRDVMELLRAWRSEQAGKAISQYVFTQDNSPEPIHPQSPTRYMKKFSEKYGIPGLHPHKLRH
ncbi:MAG: tyrosine-type recombinase/integrase, partial [Faecousia sp.]